MGVAATVAPKGLGLKTRPKSWPTASTFWVNRKHENLFSKISGLNPPLRDLTEVRSPNYFKGSEMAAFM